MTVSNQVGWWTMTDRGKQQISVKKSLNNHHLSSTNPDFDTVLFHIILLTTRAVGGQQVYEDNGWEQRTITDGWQQLEDRGQQA